MKRNKQIWITLNSLSVVCLFCIKELYQLFLDTTPLLSSLHAAVRFVFVVLLNILTYSVLLALLTLLYKKLIWRNKYRKLNIDGRWYHVHMMDDDSRYLRIGSVTVEQDFFLVNIIGENYNFQLVNQDKIKIIEEQRTDWKEENCNLDLKGELVGCYSAKRTFNNYTTRQGIHQFKIEPCDRFPQLMTGSFQDASPFRRTGVIKMYRNKEERDAFVKKICRERNLKKSEVNQES